MPRIKIYDSEGQYRELEVIDADADFTQGDILYYDGQNFIRLPLGTAGQVLTVNAGATAPEWA